MTAKTERRIEHRELATLAVLAMPSLAAWAWPRADPVRALAWLTWTAPAMGCLVASPGTRLFAAHLVLPATAMAVLSLQDAASSVDLPRPLWGAAVLWGLHFLGLAVGRLAPAVRLRSAGGLLLAGALLSGLPSLGGLLRAPWPPALAARLLDLSPVVLAEECAGVDWMRHRAVYDPVGTHSIGPELRGAWRGSLAGPLALVVGCVLAAVARRPASAEGPPRRPNG